VSIHLQIENTFYNALRVVSAKNDVRYYLNGIMIDFEKKRWAATNGHRLLTIPMDMNVCEWEDFPKKQLPAQLIIATTRQKITGDTCEIHMEKRDGQWMVTVCNRRNNTTFWQEIVEVIDGKFPDIDRVIPAWPKDDPTSIPLAAYNPEYAADVTKELKLQTPRVRIVPSGDANSSALVEFGDIERSALTYVLMPIRW